jgi:hypothetical protein
MVLGRAGHRSPRRFGHEELGTTEDEGEVPDLITVLVVVTKVVPGGGFAVIASQKIGHICSKKFSPWPCPNPPILFILIAYNVGIGCNVP